MPTIVKRSDDGWRRSTELGVGRQKNIMRLMVDDDYLDSLLELSKMVTKKYYTHGFRYKTRLTYLNQETAHKSAKEESENS